MEPRVVMHIGANKTGTSALQQFLNAHRPELARHGLLYPIAGCSGEAHYDLSAALGFTHDPTPDVETQARQRAAIGAALEAEIADARPRLVLISSEYFVLPAPVAPVRAFLGGRDTRILVYLRRHDTWWESAYAQAVRSVAHPPWEPGPESFIDWCRRHDPGFGDHEALLERWAAVFGPERIIVRPYERRQNQPDLLVDCLNAIGAGELTQHLECVSAPVNRSLPPRFLWLADLYQRLAIAPPLRQRLLDHVIDLPAPGPAIPLLSPAARRWLVEEHAAAYARIARTYLHRADGRLFYDPPPDDNDDWEPPPASPRQAVEATLMALGLLS